MVKDQRFENLFDDYLYRHCAVEFGRSSGIVFESHGYKDDMSEIVDVFYNVFKDDLWNMKAGTNKHFIYKNMDVFGDMDVFFTGFHFDLYVNLEKGWVKAEATGGYNDESLLKFDGDSIEFVPDFYVSAKGSDVVDMIDAIEKSIAHELTHAYNDYEVFINSGGRLRLGDVFLQGYDSNASKSFSAIRSNVGDIVYFTDESERNAHIAQIKQELENYDGLMSNSMSMTNAIKSTETYGKLMMTIDMLANIRKALDIDSNATDKNIFLKTVNTITNNKFRTCEQAYNFLKHRVANAQRKFYQQAPKIAMDVFMNKKYKF